MTWSDQIGIMKLADGGLPVWQPLWGSSIGPLPTTVKLDAPFGGCVEERRFSPERALDDLPGVFDNAFAGLTRRDCDSDTGSLKFTLVAWGGTEGGIGIGGSSEPTAWGEIAEAVAMDFAPDFSGRMRIETSILVNGVASAAAGSGLAADVPDSIGEFLLEFLPDLLEGLLHIITAPLNPTVATATVSGFLDVSGEV